MRQEILLMDWRRLSTRTSHRVTTDRYFIVRAQVSFTFEIPYIKRYQPQGLTYYYTVWQDEKHGRQRMERGTAEKRALETVIQNVDEVPHAFWMMNGYHQRWPCVGNV